MNLKNKMIMEAYRMQRMEYLQLGDIVASILKETMEEHHMEVLAVEYRIKKEDSLKGKLERKGDKYASIEDITDILGTRIICFFSDDVDRIAEIVERIFNIDRANSIDKRIQLDPTAFGYLSLHYIASLPLDVGYPENLCNKRFEIQIRSSLQHTWASIQHDLGYKTDFGIPKNLVRELSRVAGLLEIADSEFVEIRNSTQRYEQEIRQRIAENCADDVWIDLISLSEFVHLNKEMNLFLKDLASINQAEVMEISPENYLSQLVWLGKKKLGDLQQMLQENKELAYLLAEDTLKHTDLDILSSNVGLRYLCHAELLKQNRSIEQIEEFLTLSTGDSKRSERQARHLLDVYEKVKHISSKREGYQYLCETTN